MSEEIKCACSAHDCPTQIKIQGKELWFTDKYQKETLMYLDANAIVLFIAVLKKALLDLAVGDKNE